MVEKANSDFEGNRKEFWPFVGRRTKVKKKGIVALRNSAGISVTSTKGKLYYRVITRCWVLVAYMLPLMIVGNERLMRR